MLLLPIHSRALNHLGHAVARRLPQRFVGGVRRDARPLTSSMSCPAFSSSSAAGSSLSIADVRSKSRSLRKIGIHSPALDAFRARQAARRSQPRGFRPTSTPLKSAAFEQRLEQLDSNLKEQLATLDELQTRLGLEMRTVGNLNIARLRSAVDDPQRKAKSKTAHGGRPVIVECQYYPQKQSFAQEASLLRQDQGGVHFAAAVTAPESYAGDCLFQCRAVPGHAVFVEKVKVHSHDSSTSLDADLLTASAECWISFDELDADVQKRYGSVKTFSSKKKKQKKTRTNFAVRLR